MPLPDEIEEEQMRTELVACRALIAELETENTRLRIDRLADDEMTVLLEIFEEFDVHSPTTLRAVLQAEFDGYRRRIDREKKKVSGIRARRDRAYGVLRDLLEPA